MKRFTFLFQQKSNSYIPLCILLLFFCSPTTVYATEYPTQMTEATTIEAAPTEIPEEILTEEIPFSETSTIENSIPEIPLTQPPFPELPPQDITLPDISTPPIETSPILSEENFIVEAFDGTYYITSSGGLNVRRGPSIQHDIIGSLPYGEKITVTGKVNNDWLEIPFQGTNGYISAKYVSTEPLATLPIETEEIPESPETLIEETNIKQDFSPFISDTTLILLFIAIIAIIVLIIITIFSFFRNNHKHDYEESDTNYDTDENYDSSYNNDSDNDANNKY